MVRSSNRSIQEIIGLKLSIYIWTDIVLIYKCNVNLILHCNESP